MCDRVAEFCTPDKWPVRVDYKLLADLLKKWLTNIHQAQFTPMTYSRLCTAQNVTYVPPTQGCIYSVSTVYLKSIAHPRRALFATT